MNRRVLAIDDEPYILATYERTLRAFTLETATDANTALTMLNSRPPFAVVISDMRMPGMDGIELLAKCKELHPDSVRIMISGNTDFDSAVEAVNEDSLFRILPKPCHPKILAKVVEEAVRQYQLVTSERELLNQTLNGSLQVMIDILGMMDAEAFGKAALRREVAKIVAQTMGIGNTWDIEVAALLSDIGRVTMPSEVLRKRHSGEAMSSFEKDLWNRLPEISSKLLSNIPRLNEVANIVFYKNKYYDGSGFPADEIRGEAVPIGARILRAVEGFLSLKQDELALAYLDSGENLYDPAVVDAIHQSLDKLKKVSVGVPTTSPRKIALEDLEPGQKLCSDIRSMDGVLVMAAGQVLQSVHIQKINNCAKLSGIQQPIEIM